MTTNVNWVDIEKNYPDQWAFITNVKIKDGAITSCDVLKICSKEEKIKWARYFRSQNIQYECERTTYNAPSVGALI